MNQHQKNRSVINQMIHVNVKLMRGRENKIKTLLGSLKKTLSAKKSLRLNQSKQVASGPNLDLTSL